MPRRRKDENGNEILTDRERAFAQILANDPMMNRTNAAIEAGYSPRSAYNIGSKKMRKDEPVIKDVRLQRNVFEEELKEKRNYTKEEFLSDLEFNKSAMRKKIVEEQCPAAVNASNRTIELQMKIVGVGAEKIELDATTTNTHSIDLFRLLETDRTTMNALELIMQRMHDVSSDSA